MAKTNRKGRKKQRLGRRKNPAEDLQAGQSCNDEASMSTVMNTKEFGGIKDVRGASSSDESVRELENRRNSPPKETKEERKIKNSGGEARNAKGDEGKVGGIEAILIEGTKNYLVSWKDSWKEDYDVTQDLIDAWEEEKGRGKTRYAEIDDDDNGADTDEPEEEIRVKFPNTLNDNAIKITGEGDCRYLLKWKASWVMKSSVPDNIVRKWKKNLAS